MRGHRLLQHLHPLTHTTVCTSVAIDWRYTLPDAVDPCGTLTEEPSRPGEKLCPPASHGRQAFLQLLQNRRNGYHHHHLSFGRLPLRHYRSIAAVGMDFYRSYKSRDDPDFSHCRRCLSAPPPAVFCCNRCMPSRPPCAGDRSGARRSASSRKLDNRCVCNGGRVMSKRFHVDGMIVVLWLALG